MSAQPDNVPGVRTAIFDASDGQPGIRLRPDEEVIGEYEFVNAVMYEFGADRADAYDMLFWRHYRDGLHLFAQCNDFFLWGCSDVEEIMPDDLALLRQCNDDIPDSYEAILLYCARHRGRRPQKPYYDLLEAEHHHLFDAAGPAMMTGIWPSKAGDATHDLSGDAP